MAKNNTNKTSKNSGRAPKGFATDRKKLNKIARVIALVICVAMVLTTFLTWGMGTIL